MIRCVFGVPGSGKSYLAMKFITDRFSYDEFYHTFIPKTQDLLVITNIVGLKIHHLKLDDLVDRFGLETFFTIENFEKIQKQYRTKQIILVVDEAQRYFPNKFYNNDVFYFFEYHRHLGLDIFLITQSQVNLPKRLVELSEQVYTALPRSLSPGFFTYSITDIRGTKLGTKRLKKDKIVFLMYKSFENDEIDKPKSSYRKFIIPAVFAVSLMFVFAFITINKAKKLTQPKIKKPVVSDNKSIVVKDSVKSSINSSVSSINNNNNNQLSMKIKAIFNINNDTEKFKIITENFTFNFEQLKRYKCFIYKDILVLKCDALPDAYIYAQASKRANENKNINKDSFGTALPFRMVSALPKPK